MAMTFKKILGITTTIAVAGLVVYSVKKHFDAKKQDEQSFGIEDAKRMVEDAEIKVQEPLDVQEIVHDALDSAYDKVGYAKQHKIDEEAKRVIAVKVGEELPEEPEEEEVWSEEVDPQELQDSKGYYEEDKDVLDDLRYQPNTVEAREQFVNMELANLGRDNDTRDVVAMLYNHPFVPKCDEDQNLKVRLQDHRIKFFGIQSKWNNDITFGDVVMYYGKAAEYNCGNTVLYWVDYFLNCANLNDILLTSEDIEDQVKVLNKHTYYNEDTQSHGMFGLSSSQMTEACAVASGRIDGQLTYDLEFNIFMQGVIQ